MRNVKKIFFVLLIVILVLVSYLVINALLVETKQLKMEPVAKVDIPQSAVGNMSQAIQIQTVSVEKGLPIDTTAFQEFTTFLTDTYPIADSILNRTEINTFSHLYTWAGSDPTLKPVVLMAHLDVVPVIEANLDDWDQDPFGGQIEDGIIWGRGAIDDKVCVVGLLEAVELLLKQNFQPARTVYLAFGHDEEIGGQGAIAIADYLKNEGVEAEFILDEGGVIVENMIPGIEQAALIGIAEKGYISLELSTTIDGGHSSMPKSESAIDVISKAVLKLKQNPFPSRISPPLQAFIDYLGPEMPFGNKLVFANSGLLSPLILQVYDGFSEGQAMIRTTTAPTIFSSGVKDNVIPRIANATVNFRILPGDTHQSIIDRVNETIDDPRVKVSPLSFGSEASKVSPIDAYGFEQIHRTIAEIYPDMLVSPSLVIAATDSRHYGEVSDNIYRFTPIRINKENVTSFHGINERIAVDEFNDAIRFYVQLIRNSTSQNP